MSARTPGPATDLIEHAAGIIVAKKREPDTAPYHWAGALWEAGMLVAPGTSDPAATPRAVEAARIEALEARLEWIEAAARRVRARCAEREAKDCTYIRIADVLAALDSTDPVEDAPTRAVIVLDDHHGHKIGEEVVDGPPFPTDFGSGQLRRAQRPPTRGRLDAQRPEERSDEGPKTLGCDDCDRECGERCECPGCTAPVRSDSGLPVDGEERKS